ncbi:unnamed protein product [Symbiodinium necroappetens]|uniref:Uncharacterized protein n=1 Tax=Symbiodinium necroappetens TaxID=1628268 RepID=A0A813CPJ3_9DINO|nr:unnamed protein product [Symbiodinium necroappetens]
MIPSQWERHSSRACSSDSLLLQASEATIVDRGLSLGRALLSEADCRAQCDARWDCSFASWSSSSCSLYSQCLQVSKSQFKLFQKSSDARWQLGPLLISNLLSLLFPSMSGLAMCSVLASAGWSLVASGLEIGVAAALSAASLVLQFAAQQQLQERKMHVQKDEAAKNVRQREIEQKLWKEAGSVWNRFRGLVHNPLDEIVNAMESVADRAWEIEQLLDQEAENAAVEDGKSSALAVKGMPNATVKAGLLNKAKHHLQAYASRLQSDPGMAFDRDDLLTELAKATEDAGAAAGGAAVDICKKVAFAVSGGWIGVGAAVGATVASHGRASNSAEAPGATESLAVVEDGDGLQRRATKGTLGFVFGCEPEFSSVFCPLRAFDEQLATAGLIPIGGNRRGAGQGEVGKKQHGGRPMQMARLIADGGTPEVMEKARLIADRRQSSLHWEGGLAPRLLARDLSGRSRHRNQSPDPSKALGSIPGKTETIPRPADAVQRSEQSVTDADAPQKSGGTEEVSTPGTASECTDADPCEVAVAASPAKQITRPGLAALALLLTLLPGFLCRMLEVNLPSIQLHFQRTDGRDHLPSDISRQQVLEVIRGNSALPKRWQISESDAASGDPVVYVTTSTASRWEETLFVERQFRQLKERIHALLLIRLAPFDQCEEREERDKVEEFISEHNSYKHFGKPVWICSWDGELKIDDAELRLSVNRLDRALLPYWWRALAMPKFLW